MGRVTELRVRADWGIIRLAYLPLLVVGLALARILPWVGVLMLRAAPCAICFLLARWINHMEESLSCKPIVQINPRGLLVEDGEDAIQYGWDEIRGVVMHRRNPIPPWRTDGSTEITPRYWLAISVSDADYQPGDGDLVEEGHSYVQRRRKVEGEAEAEPEALRTISLWPRQIQGGLFSLMRFAKELQGQLLERADRGEIPRLMPEGTQ